MPTEIKGDILQPVQEFYNVWAYNHNYYTITASSITSDADFLDITDGVTKIRLYPEPNGVFTFDAYEYSRELFSYKDTYDYTSDLIDNNQFKNIVFDITITLNDSTTESQTLDITFYNGVVQGWESPNVLDYNDNIEKLPYFDGYPFDYSIITATEVTRTSVIDLNLINVIDNECGGVYLKFHSKAGYKYFLFNDKRLGSYNPKSLGSLKEQFSWTNNMFELGKTGQRTINIFSRVEYQYRELMYMLASSNEVYMYTGEKGDTDVLNKWLEVQVNLKVDTDINESAFEQFVTIMLPKEQTRTRI